MHKLRHLILPSLLILALSVGLSYSQVINKAIQLSQDASGAFGVDTTNNVYFPGHILSTGTAGPAPVLSACITGGSPTLVGTDFAGTLTAGTTASTSCVVTFGRAYVTAPNCLVTYKAGGPPATYSWATSTTALTITQASTASVQISYMCTSSS